MGLLDFSSWRLLAGNRAQQPAAGLLLAALQRQPQLPGTQAGTTPIARTTQAQARIAGTRRFNADSQTDMRFEDLPPEVQTVLASILHQYGPNLAGRTPKFWGHATQGRWDDVMRELRNFGDAHSKRRNAEADYMERAVESLQGATESGDLGPVHSTAGPKG